MSKLLPGSSEPGQSEIQSLQQWCDRAPLGIPVPSGDLHDFDVCIELIADIVGSVPDDAETRPSTGSDASGHSEAGENDSTSQSSRFLSPKWVGSGAHGIIFSAVDTQRANRKVAIKLLRPSRQNNRISRERFVEEAELMQGLNHPNIAVVVDIGVVHNTPYIVTELAEEGSLASILASNPNRFTTRQAAWLVKQVAEAVHYAHSIPILHRDIKPGNVLLRSAPLESSEGTGLWPLLTDFGLSKNLGVPAATPRTRLGEVLGTLAYMSPEQVRGEPLKTQSDIFPLGVILYELTHGNHPFLARSNFETQQNIVQGAIPKAATKERRVPKALDAIIAKCLQKNPEDRYRSASDLAGDLQKFLTGQPISVTAPTPLELFTQLLRSNPIAATFIATLFCALLAIILLLNREWQVQRGLVNQTQLIAKDRAQIGGLFFESLLVNNHGIYDTILAGQRVGIDALQVNLEKQLPLLEAALSLDPSDEQLIRQLEVNFHYLSLCLKHHCDSHHMAKGAERVQAIEARKKSLYYLDLLLERNPGLRKLLVAKTNGLYWLSMLYLDNDQAEEALQWTRKALEHGQEFLKKHPDDLAVQETINAIRILLADQLHGRDPDASLELYASAAESSRILFANDPALMSNLVYVIQAECRRGALLVRQGRIEEGYAAQRKSQATYDEFINQVADPWKLAEELMRVYLLTCAVNQAEEQYPALLGWAEEWQSFVESTIERSYSLGLNYVNVSNADTRVLLPLYYRWLALSKIHGDDSEIARAAHDELRSCVNRCSEDTDFRFNPPSAPYSYSDIELDLSELKLMFSASQKLVPAP